MSELKVYKPYATRDGDMFLYHKGDEDLMLDDEDEIYLKYEVDKAISDLEESHKMEVEQLLMEIVELKDKLQNVSGLLKETREWLIESQRMHKRCADGAIKKIRHHKYKRCLAMAKYCDMGLTCYNEKLDRFSCERADFFYRWYNRWWKLAEKFKEAK